MIVDDVSRLAKEIGERFHPDSVLLFGSHARGDARPESDVDLLVVMDYEGGSADEAVQIRQSLVFRFPLDLIGRSFDEIERRVRLGDYFLRDILREGKVLYESDDRR